MRTSFPLFVFHSKTPSSRTLHRHEVRTITKIVEVAVKKYFPEAEVTAMGSYRRGELQCGDVDVLITHKAYQKTTPLGAMCELVERLKGQGHISHHLTKVETSYFTNMPSQDDEFIPNCHFSHYPNSQSYMGVFNSPKIRGKHRRIDIKFYPYRERIYATVYFTGNGYFSKSNNIQFNLHYCKLLVCAYRFETIITTQQIVLSGSLQRDAKG